ELEETPDLYKLISYTHEASLETLQIAAQLLKRFERGLVRIRNQFVKVRRLFQFPFPRINTVNTRPNAMQQWCRFSFNALQNIVREPEASFLLLVPETNMMRLGTHHNTVLAGDVELLRIVRLDAFQQVATAEVVIAHGADSGCRIQDSRS